MKAPSGARKNHTNTGSGSTTGLAATHHTTRLADAPDISGGPAPATDGRLKKVHQNSGGGATDGFAATHENTRIHDAAPLPVDIMDAGE